MWTETVQSCEAASGIELLFRVVLKMWGNSW